MFRTLLVCLSVLSLPIQSEEVGFGKEPLIERSIGALEERWQFPSDHLPVGATIADFHVVTWNVLNTAFIDWIKRDGQGLSRSLIMQEHEFVGDTDLTVREQHVVREVLNLIGHPTHPRSILALQECSPAFLKELKAYLPHHMKIIRSRHYSAKDQDVLIYDTSLFEFVKRKSKVSRNSYPSSLGKTIMNIVLQKKDSGAKYRLINTHVPGDPALPGRCELAKYVMEHRSEGIPTIVLGDMNFNHWEMQDAFRTAASALGIEDPFENFASYYSNIGIRKEAKCIDHIFVEGVAASGNRPQDVLEGLEEIVGLLY
jgi:endonuclease/exonuclease/phosphatase family metal-dependent hydrolase